MKAADICPVSAPLPRSAFSFFVIRHWSFVIRLVLLTDHESHASRLRPWRFPPWLAVLSRRSFSEGGSLSEGGCPSPLAPKTEKPPRHSCAPAASRNISAFRLLAFQLFNVMTTRGNRASARRSPPLS